MKPFRVYIDTSVIGGCFDLNLDHRAQEFFGLLKIDCAEIIATDRAITR